MQHKKYSELSRHLAANNRRDAALDRLFAAVQSMGEENRLLQSEVSEFQEALGDLRDGVGQLADTTDDYRFALDSINTRPLRRAARRLENIADGWISQTEKSAA